MKITCTRVIFLTASLIVLSCSGSKQNVTSHTTNPGNTPRDANMMKCAILDYLDESSDELKLWIDQRFKLRVDGHTPLLPDVKRMRYFDIFGIFIFDEYPNSIYLEMMTWAENKGINFEDILIHSKINYTYVMGQLYNGLDQFGIFEGYVDIPKNGILKTADGITFEDLSTDAVNRNRSVTLSDTMYIGYEGPYMEINMDFHTYGSAVVKTFEYYNGSGWSPLTIIDGTNNFTRNGKITFQPPADWSPVSVNSSYPKYFMRIIFVSAAVSPVTVRIFGDDWQDGAGNNLGRGWDATAPGVNNSNPRFSFNMDPPAGSSAKFPYQSRISFWFTNHFITNPADRQDMDIDNDGDIDPEVSTWAAFAAEKILELTADDGGYEGIMCDDAMASVNAMMADADENDTDFADKAEGVSWADYSVRRFRTIKEYVKLANPALLIGLNGADKILVTYSDWALYEFHTRVTSTNDWALIGDDSNNYSLTVTYDDFQTENNADHFFGLMIYADNSPEISNPNSMCSLLNRQTEADCVSAGGVWYGPYHWDRSNRGPMAALSKHYIAMNSNTYFMYHTTPGYWYFDTDQVYLKNGAVVRRVSSPDPDISLVERWGTYFPAMGVNIGQPDPDGYNGGRRNLWWKTADEVDTVKRNGTARGDIWRRDFVNAIVLHRPGSWDSSRNELETYSREIPLGATYYPLYADGKRGAGVTAISLRINEGAVLMKHPGK